MRLHQYLARAEREDLKTATCKLDSEEGATFDSQISEKGVRHYWAVLNKTSIDGLPGIQGAHKSKTLFDRDIANKEWKQEMPLVDMQQSKAAAVSAITSWVDPKVLVWFLLGVLTTSLWSNLTGIVVPKMKAW